MASSVARDIWQMLTCGHNMVRQKSLTTSLSSILMMLFKRMRQKTRRQEGPMFSVSQAQQHQQHMDSQNGQTPLTALV